MFGPFFRRGFERPDVFGLGGFLDWFLGIRRTAISVPGFMAVDTIIAGQSGDLIANSAQTVASVYAAVHAYSDAISTLEFGPCNAESDEWEPLPNHYLWPILHDEWNIEQTAQQACDFAIRSHWLRGNSYTQIVRNGRGKVLELVPIDSGYIKPERDDGRLIFREYPMQVSAGTLNDTTDSSPSKSVETFDQTDICHTYMNYTKKILRGVSPLAYAQTSIGLGIAVDNFGLSYFTRGANPKMLLKTPKALDEKQVKQHLDHFNKYLAGMDNTNSTGILHGGMELEKITILPEEAQFLETRRFTVNEIARWFNLPPSRIGGDRSSGTYANLEQDQMAFILHSLRPVCKTFEQEFTRKLIDPSERGKVALRFNLNALIKEMTSMSGKNATPAPTQAEDTPDTAMQGAENA